MIYLVGQNMTHSRSWDMEIGRPSVEDVTLVLRPRVTCMFNLESSYFHVPLTTVRHLLNVINKQDFTTCHTTNNSTPQYGNKPHSTIVEYTIAPPLLHGLQLFFYLNIKLH